MFYGKNDSMFLTEDVAKDITPDWVFEDGSLQQAICYKDKALVVTTYNKLSEKYERFTYSAESVKDEDIKKLEALEEPVEISVEGAVEAYGIEPIDLTGKPDRSIDKNQRLSSDEKVTVDEEEPESTEDVIQTDNVQSAG